MSDDSQAFFDQLREMDRHVDELRACMTRADANGTLTAMYRRYVIGDADAADPFVVEISVSHRDTPEDKPSGMRQALAGLVEAVTAEVNEKGGGGYLLARLSDARDMLKSRQRK